MRIRSPPEKVTSLEDNGSQTLLKNITKCNRGHLEALRTIQRAISGISLPNRAIPRPLLHGSTSSQHCSWCPGVAIEHMDLDRHGAHHLVAKQFLDAVNGLARLRGCVAHKWQKMLQIARSKPNTNACSNRSTIRGLAPSSQSGATRIALTRPKRHGRDADARLMSWALAKRMSTVREEGKRRAMPPPQQTGPACGHHRSC